MTLAAGTAYLVIIEQWAYEAAASAMLGIAFTLLLVLTSMIFWLIPADSGAEIFATIMAELKNELKALMRMLWKN
jgi:hypothetical protein